MVSPANDRARHQDSRPPSGRGAEGVTGPEGADENRDGAGALTGGRLPDAHREAEGNDRTGTVIQTTPQLLRFLEVRIELLRARGLPLPPPEFAQPYARHLADRVLGFHAPETVEQEGAGPGTARGADGRTPDGIRYRVVGLKMGNGSQVRVPGIPDLAFDRIVLVALGPGYGILSATEAPVRSFLRAARYEEEENRWILPAGDPLWSQEGTKDLTRSFRAAATSVVRDGDFPIIEPFRARPGYPGQRERGEESTLISPLA